MGQREDDRRRGAALEKMGDCTTADDPGPDVTQASEPKPIATANPDIKNPPSTALRLPTASPSLSRSPSPLPSPSPSQLPPSPAPSSPVPSTSLLSPSSYSSSSSKSPLPPSEDSGEGADSTDLSTRIFRWLSTATPDALGAVGVGLAATTYFVLGRVGLVLMGAFGGVVLFAAWEARNPDVSRAVRGETGTEALARILEYHTRDLQQRSEGAEQKAVAPGAVAALTVEEQALGHAFDGFRPETRLALSGLVDSVMLEYINFWYEPIVPADQSFVMSCRRVFTSFLVTVSNHLSRKRPADAFLDFLTNSSSIVIVFFSELASAFSETPSQQQQQQESGSASTIMAADAIQNYLTSHPDSNLANLLDKGQQTSKLRMVAEDLLGFLDRQTYEFAPAHTFLREILASAVLESTLQTCSKSEWINGWIVYMLEAGEPDFSQAIDVGMQSRTDAGNNSSNSNGSSGAGAAASKTAIYVDLDGNVGNIALAKTHRKESMAHKKQLSRADEEMEEAMEEMKRMNQMIADEEARRKEGKAGGEVKASDDEAIDGAGLSSPSVSEHMSPKASLSLSGDEYARMADGLSTPLTPRSSAGESPSQPSFVKSAKPDAVKAADEVKPADAKATDAKTVDAKAADTKAANGLSTPPAVPNQFTSFDQLVPPGRDEEETSDTDDQGGRQKQRLPPPPPLTLHNATITIHDEPVADKGRLKSKPTWDFLVQIEPANSHYPGWMIVRKYGDFEKLHEVLRRIATISGATAFTEQHSMLPSWKVHTRGSLRGELERYVRDACWFQALAESEGMKRFLEKDVNNMGAGPKTGLQAFESMGKNMLGALANAPKGMAEGSKSMVGGVTGVLGNIGNIALGGGLQGLQKRHSSTLSLTGGIGAGAQAGSTSTSAGTSTGTGTSTSNGNGTATTTSSSSASSNQVTTPTSSVLQDVTAYTNRLSISTPPRTDGVLGLGSATSRRRSRDSMDSQRSSVVSTQPGRIAPMEQRHSFQAGIDGDGDGRYPTRGRTDMWGEQVLPTSNRGSRASSLMGRQTRSLSTVSLSGTRLSYLPSGGDSGQAAGPGSSSANVAAGDDLLGAMLPVGSPVRPSVRSMASASSWSIAEGREAQPQLHTPPPWKPAPPPTSYTKQYAGISEGETRVAVELLFAVINELYTLSSAWNIRRTLLAAAKSFLLRPGNPSLASIQALLQASVLDATTSDSGLAARLQQLRAKALPTDAERAAWPQPLTAEEKERLRVKARRLLIQSGVPAALMGVMGQTATADALGRVFDCLQIEDVARGLLFGILLQAARVVTH